MARRAWLFVLAWAFAVTAGAVWSVHVKPPPSNDVDSFLPAGTPHNRARALTARAFPKLAARSQIAVIAQRLTGLTTADYAWLDNLAKRGAPIAKGRVLSPATFYLRPRLVSADGQAALLVFNLESNFISNLAAQAVQEVERLSVVGRPAGLAVEITGTAGIGRDYAQATTDALHKTTWVTVAAVLVILIAIYRSPLGALVPLVSIGASVYLALVLLAVLRRAGLPASDTERIFTVVLLFGAGVDYALFWIARYREELQEQPDLNAACARASMRTGPAIVASAATTICGLTTLIATDLVPTQNAGKLLGLTLLVALLAALTFSPALARLLGRGLFWPRGVNAPPTFGQRVLWPALAEAITRYPKTMLAAGLVILGFAATSTLRIEPRFDALSELPPGSSSQRGFEIADRHFSKGQLYPNTLLVQLNNPAISANEKEHLSRTLAGEIAALPGIDNVYSLDRPLGRGQGILLSKLGGLIPAMKELYWCPAPPVLRWEILVKYPPFSPEAMKLIEQVKTISEQRTAAGDRPGRCGTVHLAGPTPYMLDVRQIVSQDQVRVMLLASAVIALIVLLVIRDWPLTLFMLLSTWLTFGAALAASEFFFVHVLGEPGLDYKVRIIVFVIVVAVGQDYNIFLVSRLLQEPAELSDREAVRRAVIHTGSVISSCGLIMAATLGSLWAGGLLLLRQVGFTLAVGILLDTFVVRPLLIPSFFLATRRKRR